VGDIDDTDYETLKDDYTVRAAAVLRVLSGRHLPTEPDPALQPAGDTAVVGDSIPGTAGDAPGPEGAPGLEGGGAVDGPGPTDGAGPAQGAEAADRIGGSARGATWLRRHRRVVLAGLGVVIVVAGVGYALTASSSDRVAGETITGENVGQSSVAQLLVEANQAEVQGNSLAELKDTRAILAKDPTQPEALTLEGWVLAQTQQPKLLAQGIGFLKLAEEIDPSLAQAHAYRGIALLSEGDNRAAIPELEWYLDHRPDPKVAPKFRAALTKAEAAVTKGAAAPGATTPSGG
jgi:hypothetical protein